MQLSKLETEDNN